MMNTEKQLARAREVAGRLGVLPEEFDRRLEDGKLGMPAETGEGVAEQERIRGMSIYEKSIIVGVLIGLCYVVRTIIGFGLTNAIRTLSYVAFCLFMISIKRLLDHRVGTYIIGTGIHLPTSRRPMWGACIVLGWVFLVLPALLTVVKAMGFR